MDNPFQIAVLGFFILFAVVGVGLFAAGSLGGGSDQPAVSFSVWGEWEESAFTALLEESGIVDNELITVSYTSINSDNFEGELVNALARGEGPDVLLIPHTKLLPLADLITPIGEEFYPQRSFRNSFVEGGEVFISSEGVKGLPIAADPLVMYWNRDLFTQNGFVAPPEFWSEVPGYTNEITETDDAGNIETAGIGLGSATNISHPKEILSALFFQAGNQILSRDQSGEYQSTLGASSQNDVTSVESAVGLYTQFANPAADTYTWSNSFTSDRQAFTAGDLGMYLAPASEIRRIRSENPNLNFDVSTIPQLESGVRRTHATVYGFSILNRAENKQLILNALDQMTNSPVASSVAGQTPYTPAHKAVLSAGAGDAYQQVFFDAAVVGRGWLDPNSAASSDIFTGIISDVTSGQSDVREAVQSADTALTNLLEDSVTQQEE